VSTWQVLQPGDDPSEGRRIEAQTATVTHGGVLVLWDADGGELVPASLFSEWSEAHRIDGDWPDRPVGEVDPEAGPW
jgi:hypothetical protein